MSSHQRVREALAGVGVTPVTPFSSDLLHINTEGLTRNTEFLVDNGVQLIYPCGNTGEFSSLSLEEWRQVVSTVIDAARDRAVIVAGIGGGITTALEMVRSGIDLGVDGFLLMPPHQPHVSDEGVRQYWLRLIAETELSVVPYKKQWPTDETLRRLIRHESVVGVKYGSIDLDAFARLVAADDSATSFTCGTAERWAPFFMHAGAVGFTSGLANFAPSFALALHRAVAGGDSRRALELRQIASPFELLRARNGEANNVPAVKVAMELVGLMGGSVRPPLSDLSREDTEEATRLSGELSQSTVEA